MNDEVWAAVAGYEGRYEVSSHGRVRSVSRLVPTMRRNGVMGQRRIKSLVLTAHTWGAPYPGIVLYDDQQRGVRKSIHHLVAQAFVPNPRGYLQINHIDSDTFNARADNLEWSDQSINVQHAYDTGRRKRGSDHHFAKLPRDRQGYCLPEKRRA